MAKQEKLAPSTRNLAALPDIETLRRNSQAIAMLDALLEATWEYRYFSYQAHWSSGQSMASMRNGSGDETYTLFTNQGAILKGFAHEAPMAQGSPWEGVLDHVPNAFSEFLDEPAFDIAHTTFCIWRTYDDNHWRWGEADLPEEEDPDGSRGLLFALDGRPASYRNWAETYYERPVSLEAVERIYAQAPLSLDILQALAPRRTLDEIAEDARSIGYPLA